MELLTYLSSLSIPNLFSRMPAAAAQGIIWGIMALGVYITFRLLNVSDLTVDGSFCHRRGCHGHAASAGASRLGGAADCCAGRHSDRPLHGTSAHEIRHSRDSRRYPHAVRPVLDQPSHHGQGQPDGQHQKLRHVLGDKRQGLSDVVALCAAGAPLQDCFFLPHWLRCCIGTSAPNREARCVPRARTPR